MKPENGLKRAIRSRSAFWLKPEKRPRRSWKPRETRSLNCSRRRGALWVKREKRLRRSCKRRETRPPKSKRVKAEVELAALHKSINEAGGVWGVEGRRSLIPQETSA